MKMEKTTNWSFEFLFLSTVYIISIVFISNISCYFVSSYRQRICTKFHGVNPNGLESEDNEKSNLRIRYTHIHSMKNENLALGYCVERKIEMHQDVGIPGKKNEKPHGDEASGEITGR